MASSSILFGDDPDWNLIRGASLAFLSQLSSIGKGLQKVGVRSLPELSPRPRVLWQYATNPTWRTGLLLDIGGALFGLAALTIVPISVAQPIFCNGLVLLALYSHFYLKENLRRREWISIFLCFAGTLMLAATLVPRDWQRTDIRWIQVKLGLVLMLTLPLLVALELAARRAKAFSLGPSVIELLAGLQAGLCIGVGNATLASGLQASAAAARRAAPRRARRLYRSPLTAPLLHPRRARRARGSRTSARRPTRRRWHCTCCSPASSSSRARASTLRTRCLPTAGTSTVGWC